jgi:hypothetical protein
MKGETPMTFDLSFTEKNLASTHRIRDLIARLQPVDYQTRVGEHWTVSVALAHLAFWDRRILFILDESERLGAFTNLQLDILLNDILLPFWVPIPAQDAARMAVETAEEVDRRLEATSQAMLEEIYANNPRLVVRALHRNEHLDEVEAALGR